MCHHCRPHVLRSGSRDEAATSGQSLDVESRRPRSPCLPRESVGGLPGTLLPGSCYSLPCLSLSMWWHSFSAGPSLRPMYFMIMSLRSNIRAFPSISCKNEQRHSSREKNRQRPTVDGHKSYMFSEQLGMWRQRCGVGVPHELHHLFYRPRAGAFTGQLQTFSVGTYSFGSRGRAGCCQRRERTLGTGGGISISSNTVGCRYLRLAEEAEWSRARQTPGGARLCRWPGGSGRRPASGTRRSSAPLEGEASWSWRPSPCSAAPLVGCCPRGAGSLLEGGKHRTRLDTCRGGRLAHVGPLVASAPY